MLIVKFDLLKCCTNLHSSQDDMQNICLYYDAHVIMNLALIKKLISSKFTDSLKMDIV